MDSVTRALAVFDNDTLEDSNLEENAVTQVISDQAMYYISIYLNFLLSGGMALFGSVNNVFNMIIFHKLGLKDSMSVGLMTLSLTDFLVSSFSLLRLGFYVWDLLLPHSHIHLAAVDYVFFGWWRDILFLCSAWITTFLSIERCICVVLPFKVKTIFSKVRSVIIVIVIFVVNIAAHIPVFASQWLSRAKEEIEKSNGTVLTERLVVKFSKNRPQIQLYIDIANGAVLPIPSMVLVLISVIWMIYGLNVSSKVRSNVASDKQESQGVKQSYLSSKEKRLVKVVLFLAIILILCNIPRFIAVYAKQIFPEVSYGESNGNLYSLLWDVTFSATSINSSVNIFVYMIVNANYRQEFLALFCSFM